MYSGTTLLASMPAQSTGTNNPPPQGSITTSQVAPVGNSAAPSQTFSVPNWFWGVAAIVILYIVFKKY